MLILAIMFGAVGLALLAIAAIAEVNGAESVVVWGAFFTGIAALVVAVSLLPPRLV